MGYAKPMMVQCHGLVSLIDPKRMSQLRGKLHRVSSMRHVSEEEKYE